MTRWQTKSKSHVGAFVLFLVGIALTLALYGIKIKAQAAQKQVKQLERQVAKVQSEIELISAEIAHLEDPARLAEMSKDSLGLEPIVAENTISLEAISQDLALREAVEGEDTP